MRTFTYAIYGTLFLFLFGKFRKSEHGKQILNKSVSALEQLVPIQKQIGTKQKQGETKQEQNGTNTKHFVSEDVLELLPYAAKYKGKDTESFFDSLFAMSERLSFRPVWVLKLMFHESGLNPQARNSIGATGLIQFLPETAAEQGTNTASILRSTGTRQLKYVERFWKPVAHRIDSYEELRLYNLFPVALGQPDDFILQSPKLHASVVAARNPSFDIDGDMKITVKEFKYVTSHER